MVHKVLKKMLHQPESKDEDIDDTLLTWSLDIFSFIKLFQIWFQNLLYFKNKEQKKNVAVLTVFMFVLCTQIISNNKKKHLCSFLLYFPNLICKQLNLSLAGIVLKCSALYK